jgi:hypothetical protein
MTEFFLMISLEGNTISPNGFIILTIDAELKK